MSLIKVQFNKLDLESHKTVNMAVTYQEYDQGVIKSESLPFFLASRLH